MNNEPVAWIKQGRLGYPVLEFNKPFRYKSYATQNQPIPLYTYPAKTLRHENHDWDRGTWTVGQTESQEFIESSDFNHDVRLYLNGDFETDAQRLNYLQHIADRLNTHPANLTDEEIDIALYVADITLDNLSDGDISMERIKAFVRAILRKAQEK